MKKRTIFIGFLSAVTIVGIGFFGYASYSKNKNTINEYEKISSKLESFQKQIWSSYEDEGRVFLKENHDLNFLDNYYNKDSEDYVISTKPSSKDIEFSKEQSAKLNRKAKSINQEAKDLKAKFTSQNEVNDLFTEKSIEGEKFNKDLSIKATVNEDSVNKVKKGLEVIPKDQLKNNLNEACNIALKQIETINVATDKVNSLFENSNLKPSVNKNAISEASKTVDSIKNSEIKAKLKEKLKKATEALDKRNQEEKSQNTTTITDTKEGQTDQQSNSADNLNASEDSNVVASEVGGNAVGSTNSVSNDSQSNNDSGFNNNSNNSSTGNGNQTSSGGSNNSNNGSNNNTVSPPVTPPVPVEPQERFTVWYTSSDDPSKNISLGQHVFSSRSEAQAWIESYSDKLLGEGISADNYGVSSYN